MSEHTDASPPLRVEVPGQLRLTPRRRELRRLAAAGRDLIEHLVSTTASEAQLAAAADDLEALAEALGALPRGKGYEGFAEMANAGGEVSVDVSDPELFAFFDHSPLIGLANPIAPPITMHYEQDAVLGAVRFGSAYEGPPGCVHGGYIAAAFDELLGATQSLSGAQGMTARLEIRYRSPTPLKTDLTMIGELISREGRKIRCRGVLMAGERLCAEADGLFIGFEPGRFKRLLADRRSTT